MVNTKGKAGNISDELKEVLVYLERGEVTGDYSRQLDDVAEQVKTSEQRRHEYMVMMIHDMEVREEGRKEGIKEGRKAGEERLAALIARLCASDRGFEIQRVAADKEYRDKLFQEFDIR